MPREISIPFRLGPDKTFATEVTPDVQIRQHVMSLINTEPGERVVLGNYGVPLAEMVFEEGDEDVATLLAQDIANGLATFEPGVQVRDVSAVQGMAEDGLSRVNVTYFRTDAPDSPVDSRNQNVVAISANGRVSEVIRG